MPVLIIFLLFVSFPATIAVLSTSTISSDIIVLKAFKNSIKTTSIPSHSCLASWNFLSDPCSLPRVEYFICGVSCDGDRITEISLDPANYSGTLSPLISMLSHLSVLDLSENNFFGTLPSSFSSLSQLGTLTLRFNSLSGSIPESFSSLKSLESLDLSHNSLSGNLPYHLSSLTTLRQLDLSYNHFSGSIPKLPPNLVKLEIRGNSLSEFLAYSSFSQSTQLSVVDLSENSLRDVIQPWLLVLPSIQQITLSHNKFTRLDIQRKPRNVSSQLNALDVGFNKLRGLLPINITTYPALTSLALKYNRLRGPIPSAFANLNRLVLEGNFLSGSPPRKLFSGEIIGSLGDNCLQYCPVSSPLCVKPQKPRWICQHI